MSHNFSKDRSLVEDKSVPKPKGPLDDFEAWMEIEYRATDSIDVAAMLEKGFKKLEELKEKYHIGQTTAST
jgi:hypothetical protein